MIDRTGWLHGPDVQLIIGYGQEVYPAITLDTVMPGPDVPDEDRAAAVAVPAALWAAYLAARAELARVTVEIVALDERRPDDEAWLAVHLRKIGGYDDDPDPDS